MTAGGPPEAAWDRAYQPPGRPVPSRLARLDLEVEPPARTQPAAPRPDVALEPGVAATVVSVYLSELERSPSDHRTMHAAYWGGVEAVRYTRSLIAPWAATVERARLYGCLERACMFQGWLVVEIREKPIDEDVAPLTFGQWLPAEKEGGATVVGDGWRNPSA